MSPAPEEPRLVRRAKGDPEAFGQLYERYVRKIYTYVYYRTGNEHETEDLTARVFQRALTHIESYEDQGLPFSAWLYRIAHNLVANWHRDHSRQQIVGLDEVREQELAEPPESLAEDAEERRLLMRVIRSLPEERQQLLILKYADDLSNCEIGQIMGRTEGAIKSLFHRTLLTLRETMLEELKKDTAAGRGPSRGQAPRRPAGRRI